MIEKDEDRLRLDGPEKPAADDGKYVDWDAEDDAEPEDDEDDDG